MPALRVRSELMIVLRILCLCLMSLLQMTPLYKERVVGSLQTFWAGLSRRCAIQYDGSHKILRKGQSWIVMSLPDCTEWCSHGFEREGDAQENVRFVLTRQPVVGA